MNKKVLITGGAGFIGSSLARRLNAQGFSITVVDRKSPPKDFTSLGIRAYSLDLGTEMLSKHLDLNEHYDFIFHFAAQTSSERSFENPLQDAKDNILTLINVLAWLEEFSPEAHLVFSSSMAIYGETSENADEYATPLAPVSNYGWSKLLCEELIKKRLPNYTIFRLFNVYGPGQDYTDLKQGMASIYIASALKNREILVKGELERIRDFIFIDDVIEIFQRVLEDSERVNQQTFNLASGKATTVNELVSLISSKLEEKTQVIVAQGTPKDIQTSRANVARMEKKFDFKTKISLSSGLDVTIEDAKAYFDAQEKGT